MKNILIAFLFSICVFSEKLNAETSEYIKRISEGNKEAKISIITYESLTCSHCADFHENVYPKLKSEFIDTGLARIEFRHFPLDLAALNASKLSQCHNDGKSNLLHLLFANQSTWIKGKTVEDANKNLKKLLDEKNINLDFEKCINDKNIEDFVLKDRIEGIKEFEVNATPTVIINNEKFDKSLNYKNLKKYLEKMI